MNRRERKHMEKELGLNKFYKKMTREQRFQKMVENIENGKRMEADMKTQRETSIQEQMDQKRSDVIANLAEEIARRKKIPLIDAMLEAQEEYESKD